MRLILILMCSVLLMSCAAQPVGNGNSSSGGRVGQNINAAAINVELGANYISTGDYRLADEKLQKALKQDPNSSVARWTYAILKEQLRQPKIAEQFYQKAIAINARDSRGHNAYASFLCRSERYQEANKHFEKALSDPLFNARASSNLSAGVCAMEIPDYELAKNYFTEVIRMSPTNRVAKYQMAKVHFLQKDYAAAQSFLRDFEEVSEHTAQSLWLAYRTERELGNVRIAKSYAKLLNEQFPSSLEAEKLARVN